MDRVKGGRFGGKGFQKVFRIDGRRNRKEKETTSERVDNQREE